MQKWLGYLKNETGAHINVESFKLKYILHNFFDSDVFMRKTHKWIHNMIMAICSHNLE